MRRPRKARARRARGPPHLGAPGCHARRYAGPGGPAAWAAYAPANQAQGARRRAEEHTGGGAGRGGAAWIGGREDGRVGLLAAWTAGAALACSTRPDRALEHGAAAAGARGFVTRTAAGEGSPRARDRAACARGPPHRHPRSAAGGGGRRGTKWEAFRSARVAARAGGAPGEALPRARAAAHAGALCAANPARFAPPARRVHARPMHALSHARPMHP
jgi:hypothetical protein